MVTVIGSAAIAVPLLLTSVKDTLLAVLLGTAIAGDAVADNLAPVTEKGALAVNVPLAAVTVIIRFEGSAPIDTVATEVPLVDVVVPL